MFSVGFWILVLLPFPVLGLWLFQWKREISKRGERVPAALTLLRPPAESLRLKVSELDEKLSEQLLLAILFPLGFAMVRLGQAKDDWGGNAVLICTALIFVWFFGRRAMKTAAELRNFRLGFRGERACGEQLNQLMLHGCRVFHDVPNDPYGNIDHVIVSPTGIYAVETKTRRMQNTSGKQEDHVVVYDGQSLRFPFGDCSRYLTQAQQQANRLQTFLSSAVGEAVRVEPILALPGWFVRRSSPRGMAVINPKTARHVVLDRRKRVLGKQLLDRIAHQLEQMCKDTNL